MKLLGLIAVSIATYAGAGALLNYGFRVDPQSEWYWLPFVASLGVLAAGLYVGFRQTPKSRTVVTVTALASAALVLVADLAVAIIHSCAKGVCI